MGRFLKFEFSASTVGCCLFCQAPVGGSNKECVTHGFDLICMNCAREIALLVQGAPPVQNAEAYTCEKCGRTFSSRMGLMAHCREHKRKESDNT